MDQAQKIYKKYISSLRVIYLTAFFVYLAVSAILNFIGLFPLVILAAVAMVLMLRRLTAIHNRRHISGIILDGLDAPLYREVISTSGIGAKNIFLEMESRFFVGDISDAVAIGEVVYRNGSAAERHRYSVLPFLAQYYYCLGDDEGLASVCRRFRELKPPKRGARVRDSERIIGKYEYYLAGDYDSFVRPINPKLKGTLYPLVTSFNEARVALKRGELQSARTIFSSLSAAADNTVFGMLSRRAVEAIDGGVGYSETVAQTVCDQVDAEAAVEKFIAENKKIKKTGRIFLIFIAACLVLALPGSIRSWLREVDEKITLRVLDEHYDNIEIIDMFWFKVDGKRNELTFFAEIDGDLYLGGRYRDENGDLTASIYSVCRLSELEENGRFLQAFSNHDNSAHLYFHVNREFFYVDEDDVLLYGRYYVGERFITVVIDDEVID